MWIKNLKPLMWPLIILCVIIGLAFTYFAGIWSGGDKVEKRQAIERLKQNETIRKADERIENTAPDGSDKRTAIDWLQKHTRN